MVKSKKSVRIVFSFLLTVLIFTACRIDVQNKDNIFLQSTPDKTEYFVGDYIDYTGLVVNRIQEDGTETELTDYTIEPAAGTMLDKAGKTKVKITWNNKSLTFKVNVKEVEITGLYVVSAPDKTYYEGDTLDLSGVELEVVKNNGTKEIITDFTAEPPNGTILNESGNNVIKLTYGKKSVNYEIEVNPIVTTEICLYTIPQSAYYVGEKLNLDELQLEVLKNNGTKEIITEKDFTAEPLNGSVLEKTENGRQTVTITYDSHTCSFEILVYEVNLEKLYVKNMPNLINYYTNDLLDYTGLVVEGLFDNGVTEEISGYFIEPANLYELTEPGDQSVKIKYLDKIVIFEVSVSESIFKFTQQPEDCSYSLYSDDQKLEASVQVDGTGTLIWSMYRKNPGEEDFTLLSSTDAEEVDFGKEYTKIFDLPQNNFVTAQYFCRAEITKGVTTKHVDSEACTVEQTVNTGLATVIIQTDKLEKIVEKDKKLKADMIIKEKDGKENAYSLIIYGAGNATWTYEKKPYKLKLDSKAALLGMDENKDWRLLANYCDKTLMRTALGFKTSELLKMDWSPSAEYVELIINKEYLGNYQLAETVKRDENRVVLDDSGYLWEIDNYYYNENVYFFSEHNNAISFKFPETEAFLEDEEKLSYIEDYVNVFENILYSDDEIAFDLENGYQKYADIDSLARFYLLHNILENCDMNRFFKKYDNTVDSRIKAGPAWDFEWSIGIGWYYGERPNPNHFWIQPDYFGRLWKDLSFQKKVKDIWEKDFDEDKQKILLDFIDELTEMLQISQGTNFKRWPIMNKIVSVGGIPLGSYYAEVECDKAFLISHFDWLQNQLDTIN